MKTHRKGYTKDTINDLCPNCHLFISANDKLLQTNEEWELRYKFIVGYKITESVRKEIYNKVYKGA